MGYGDDIMATGEARIIKKQKPNLNIVFGDGEKIYKSEIFRHNPHIYQGDELDGNKEYYWINNYIGNRPYIDYKKTNSKKIFWKKNFNCTRGDIFFDENEEKNGQQISEKAIKIWQKYFNKKPKILVIIEPVVKSESYQKTSGAKIIGNTHLNRDWGFENWQKVVDALKDNVAFLQPFRGNVRKLKGVLDVDCNFRNAAAILKYSDLFVGNHGGFTHAAAALNKPAVNIFGGWISPEITGYKSHFNFYIDTPDSPCGYKIKCSHCYDCMKSIEVDSVIDTIKSFLK